VRSGSFPLPRRATVPVLGCIGLLALWAIVARDSGIGWVQAVGALVAGALAVGLAGPAVALSRLRVTISASPADAVRGTPAHLRVRVNGPAELRALDPPGPPAGSGRADEVVLELTPDRRGPLDEVTISVASAAPFGLLWWARRVVLTLDRPMVVAPRTGPADEAAVVARATSDPAAADTVAVVRPAVAASTSGTEPRGVRAYAYGDRRHLVHWPATAHTGALMIRETERLLRTSTVVDGTLPDEPEAAERHAERVLGTVAALLARGATVRLKTVEPAGVVLGTVETSAEAGRRLAFALPVVTASPRLRATRQGSGP